MYSTILSLTLWCLFWMSSNKPFEGHQLACSAFRASHSSVSDIDHKQSAFRNKNMLICIRKQLSRALNQGCSPDPRSWRMPVSPKSIQISLYFFGAKSHVCGSACVCSKPVCKKDTALNKLTVRYTHQGSTTGHMNIRHAMQL